MSAAEPEVRIGLLEGRMSAAESNIQDMKDVLTRAGEAVTEVRLGTERLHADVRVNTEVTEGVKKAVEAIQKDTAEIIAVYKSRPTARWYLIIIGAIASFLVTLASFINYFHP